MMPFTARPSSARAVPGDDLGAVLDRAPPVLVGLVPGEGGGDALLEADARFPAEVLGDAGGVDGVAPVVARPVGHELDAVVGQVEGVEDRLRQLHPVPLGAAADA